MYNINGVRLDCKELLEISQQRWVSQTENFRAENRSTFGSTYECEHIFCDEASQVSNRN